MFHFCPDEIVMLIIAQQQIASYAGSVWRAAVSWIYLIWAELTKETS